MNVIAYNPVRGIRRSALRWHYVLLAEDHVLSVMSFGMRETYARYYFRDICYVAACRAPLDNHLRAITSSTAGVFVLLALLLHTPPVLVISLIGIAVAAFFELSRSSARLVIATRTGVDTFGVRSMAHAREFVAELRTRVEQQQGWGDQAALLAQLGAPEQPATVDVQQ